MFSHEVVPDHLRTKPDPEVEEQEKQLSTDAARIGTDVAQVGQSLINLDWEIVTGLKSTFPCSKGCLKSSHPTVLAISSTLLCMSVIICFVDGYVCLYMLIAHLHRFIYTLNRHNFSHPQVSFGTNEFSDPK